MTYYLFKSEPSVYSFDNLVRDGETTWDGVTAPAAVKNLREMKPGTKWILYHTGDERTAVGTGTVLSVDASDPKVPIVRVKPGKRLKHPKTLADIKAEKLFVRSPLVTRGTWATIERDSCHPVPPGAVMMCSSIVCARPRIWNSSRWGDARRRRPVPR